MLRLRIISILYTFAIGSVWPVLTQTNVAVTPSENKINKTSFTGFRHDNSGNFPADCTPPIFWKESAPGSGQGENIVYAAKLPNWGLSGMILVQGRMFVVREPLIVELDWSTPEQEAISRQRVEVAPVLMCLDPVDGKTLWEKEITTIVNLPENEQRHIRDQYASFGKYWSQLTKLRWELAAIPDSESNGEKARKIMQRLSELGHATNPDDPKPAAATLKDGNRGNAWMGQLKPETKQRFSQLYKELDKHGIYSIPWTGQQNGTHAGQFRIVGSGFMTPASDTKHVYVATSHGGVACYKVDGTLRWFRQVSTGGKIMYASPVIADGKLILVEHGYEKNTSVSLPIIALDLDTGKVVWTTKAQSKYEMFGYMSGTPVQVRAGNTDALFIADGRLLRLPDGRELLGGIGFSANVSNLAVLDDTVYVFNSKEGGGYGGGDRPGPPPSKTLWAVRFSEQNGKVDNKVAFEIKESGGSPLIVGERLIAGIGKNRLGVLDAQTGSVLFHIPTQFKFDWYYVSAGGYLYGATGSGETTVVKLEQNDAKLVASNQVGDWGNRRYYATQYLFSGNRAWIRWWDRIYCFGSGEMRLSACHR